MNTEKIARKWLVYWNNPRKEILDAHTGALKALLDQVIDQERVRCLGIVSAARFGEVDQDYRAIHHMIESGRTVEEIKA